MTSIGLYQADYFVNAAGLYADKIALEFGFSERYRILPFKGLYLYSDEPLGAIRTNIYPVPNLRNPFLGVHFTITVDGRIKIGPTAIPTFWREHYRAFENFKFSELVDIMMREISLFAYSYFDFKRLAFEESMAPAGLSIMWYKLPWWANRIKKFTFVDAGFSVKGNE